MSEPVSIRVYALRQIGQRLDGLADAVGTTANSHDPDAIHDLRVSIRRFTQGLRLFPDFLPAAPVKRIRKKLKRMIALTSEVRNRDIALQELGEDGSEELKKGLNDGRKHHAEEFSALVREWNTDGFAEEWRSQLALKPGGKGTHERRPRGERLGTRVGMSSEACGQVFPGRKEGGGRSSETLGSACISHENQAVPLCAGDLRTPLP